MKTKIICTFLLAGIFLTGAAFSQTHAGGAAVVAPRTGVSPTVNPNVTVRPGTTTQTGVDLRRTPGQTGANTPQATITPTESMTTNNNFAGTNGLTGTNNFAGTNGLSGSNNVAANVNLNTNFNININSNFNGNVVMQDQAVTPSDRVLLSTLSQGVRATLKITPNGNAPVHFLIQNGTVTVVGTVESTAQSQAVLAQIQQTPGVLNVVNDMHVSGPFAPAVQNGANRSLLGVASDHAFSPADQTILTTVQQEAALQLGVTSLSQMPVHFSIQNGVVGVTGQVSSMQEKQALIAALSRTKGIVRVVDNVGVTSTVGTGFPSNAGGSFNGNTLTPTSRSTNQSINTNASGF